MNETAVKLLMAEIAPVIRDYMESAAEQIAAASTSALEARSVELRAENEALRERVVELEKATAPEIDLAGVEKLIADEIAKLPTPEPAKEVGREEIAALVDEAVAALPPAKDGASVTAEDVLPAIVDEVAKRTDPRDINEMVAAEVAKVVASMPPPQDGKDAAGIVEALKDSGELVLTLQDGRLVRTGIRDGEKGQDGHDGFGFDDLDVGVQEDDRTIEFVFRRGDEEKTFTLKWPTVIDRGVYKADRDLPYEPGDGVTWGGQFYVCNAQTSDKPDLSKDGKPWRLAVRKGRDGKDGKAT